MKMENSTSNGIPPSTYQTARKEKAGGVGSTWPREQEGGSWGGGGRQTPFHREQAGVAGGQGWSRRGSGEEGGRSLFTSKLPHRLPPFSAVRGRLPSPRGLSSLCPGGRRDPAAGLTPTHRAPRRPSACPPGPWRRLPAAGGFPGLPGCSARDSGLDSWACVGLPSSVV